MSNAAVDTTHVDPTPDPVATFITDAVGDVSRPRRGLLAGVKLDHLPGEGGVIVGIKTVLGWMKRGNAFLLDQQRRFGPVYRTQFGLVPIVAVSDPDLLVRITRNEDRAFSAAMAWRTTFEGIDPTSPTLDMPLTLDFELHKEARRLLQPAFNATALTSYLDVAAPRFERAIEEWTTRGKVSFKAEIRRLLATVSAQIFLGIDDEREGEMLDRALADVWGATMSISKKRWLSPSLRRGEAAYRRLRDSLRERVAARRDRGGKDLFSRLCAESRGASWLDDDGLVRLFIGVMIGAFDTTSSGMSSMAYLLAKHPDWQERLRDEALRFGRQRISQEDTKRLEVTDRVWKETLRLFPVAPDVPRATLRDVDLGPWRIPAGAGVLAMIGPLMQDPAWWTEPQRFDPDRFTEARAEDKKHKGLFLPFGAGAHACIGTQLANLEVKAFWHAMLTRCRFRLERDYEAHHTFLPLGIVSGDVALIVERVAG